MSRQITKKKMKNMVDALDRNPNADFVAAGPSMGGRGVTRVYGKRNYAQKRQ